MTRHDDGTVYRVRPEQLHFRAGQCGDFLRRADGARARNTGWVRGIECPHRDGIQVVEHDCLCRTVIHQRVAVVASVGQLKNRILWCSLRQAHAVIVSDRFFIISRIKPISGGAQWAVRDWEVEAVDAAQSHCSKTKEIWFAQSYRIGKSIGHVYY